MLDKDKKPSKKNLAKVTKNQLEENKNINNNINKDNKDNNDKINNNNHIQEIHENNHINSKHEHNLLKKVPFYDETMHNLLEIKTDYNKSTIKEPLAKFQGNGTWMNLYELKNIFNNYLIFYDPNNFRNNLNINNNWIYNYNSYEFNFDYAIIYLNNKNNIENNETLTMIIFEPNSGIKEICNELNYYISIDIVEAETAKLKENLKLTNFFGNYLLENLDKEKNYFLIIRSFLTPFGFNLNIFSDFNNIEYMNYNNYLEKIGNFSSNKFSIEHFNIEKNKNYLLAKFSLKTLDKKLTKMKINLKHKENIITNQIEIFLIKGNDNESSKKISFNCIDLFTIKPLPEGEEYYFIFMIKPLFDVIKNELEIEFLYSNEKINLKVIENLEPFKICDENNFDKKGNVFKEIMIVSKFFNL